MFKFKVIKTMKFKTTYYNTHAKVSLIENSFIICGVKASPAMFDNDEQFLNFVLQMCKHKSIFLFKYNLIKKYNKWVLNNCESDK